MKPVAISQPDNLKRTAHPPIVYFFLYVPYGAMTGYVTITLGYRLSNAGISTGLIAALVATQLLPQVIKFLWSPFVDTTLTVKKWHIISTVACSACIMMLSTIPIKLSSLPLFSVIVIISSVACSFVGIAGNCLSAHNTPGDLKGRVSGYIQAGNVGGSAIGGGAGLWLSQHMADWMAGGIIAIAFLLCCIGLFFVNEPDAGIKAKTIAKTTTNLLKDVWVTIKRKKGIVAMILCLIPVGTCASSNLFSSIAKDWHTSGNVVALVTGVVGGFLTIFGCLLGGWLCDLMDRKAAYVWFGLIQGAFAVGMAFCPHTQLMYITWTLLYSTTTGLTYAAFNAFTLEVIGKGAAATKFELYASVSNAPIYTMTVVAGIAYTKWGANGMLNTEAIIGLFAAILYIIVKSLIEMKKASPESAEFAEATV